MVNNYTKLFAKTYNKFVFFIEKLVSHDIIYVIYMSNIICIHYLAVVSKKVSYEKKKIMQFSI